MWDCMWGWRRGGWKRAGPEMGVFISLGMSILSLQFYRLLAGSFYFLCGPVLVKKKKQAKQNVEMKMWSSSRPDLKLGDVTPNWLGLFLSLFPFFLILNFLLNGCRHSCEKRGIQSSRDVTTQAFWWANTRPECCNFPLVHWTLEKAAHLQSEWKRDEAVARIFYHYLENVVGNEVQKERNYCKSR